MLASRSGDGSSPYQSCSGEKPTTPAPGGKAHPGPTKEGVLVIGNKPISNRSRYGGICNTTNFKYVDSRTNTFIFKAAN